MIRRAAAKERLLLLRRAIVSSLYNKEVQYCKELFNEQSLYTVFSTKKAKNWVIMKASGDSAQLSAYSLPGQDYAAKIDRKAT